MNWILAIIVANSYYCAVGPMTKEQCDHGYELLQAVGADGVCVPEGAITLKRCGEDE